jgi:uncharacterized membrane protein
MRHHNPITPQFLITAMQAWLLHTVFSALTDDSNTEHSAQWAANGLSILGTLMLVQMFNRLFLQKDTAKNPCTHLTLAAFTLLPTATLTSIASWNSPANLQHNPDITDALLSGQAASFLRQFAYFTLAIINQKDPYKIWGHCASAAANGIGMLAMTYATTHGSNHYNRHRFDQAELMHTSATVFTLVGVGLHILSAALMITRPYYQATQAAIAAEEQRQGNRVDPQAEARRARRLAMAQRLQMRTEQTRLALATRIAPPQASTSCVRRP